MKRDSLALAGFCLLGLIGPSRACPQEEWLFPEGPRIQIGETDGEDPFVFDDIRGAVLGGGGEIVVADGTSGEIRVFTESGRFVRAFGGRGYGPEEFGGILWIDWCGSDSLVAYDFARRRVTKWSLRGDLLDEFLLEGPDHGVPPNTVSCGSNGAFVAVGWPDFAGYSGGVGPYRSDVQVGLVDERGQLERVVGKFPGPERYRWETNDGPRPFGRRTIARIDGKRIYVGTGDSFQVQVLSLDGERGWLGRDIPKTPLTDEIAEFWRDSIVNMSPAQRRPAVRRAVEDHELPRFLPAYSEIQIDRLGLIWIAHYGLPGATLVEWDVFDPENKTFVAFMEIPRHFRPMEIGEEHLLGVSTDALGVERVRLYPFSRGDD